MDKVCDCGAPADGKWAGKHSANCATARASEPTIEEIAKIIGCAPNDLDEGCDRSCETDGGTCICVELHSTAAVAIIARFRKTRSAT